jgi:nitrogen fixation/metabolism regulation signal transduction histidine kinase/CheY-like chemotaxis protein
LKYEHINIKIRQKKIRRPSWIFIEMKPFLKILFNESGLRVKIMILFFIVASIPIVFGSIFTLTYVNTSIIESSKDNIEDKLKTAILLYDKKKNEIEKITRSAASDNIIIINLGLLLYPPIASHLKNLIKTGNLSFLSVLDKEGRLIVSGNKNYFDTPDEPVADKKLLELALKKETIIYSGLITSHELLKIEEITSDRSAEVYSMLCLSPIFSYSNKHIGFLFAGHLLSNDVNDMRKDSLVEEIHKDVDAAIIFADNEKPIVYSNGKIHNVSSGFPISSIGDNNSIDLDKFYNLTINSKDFLYKFSRISDINNNRFYLGVGIQKEKFYSVRNRSLLFLSLITLMSIAISVFMAYIFSKSITSPILSIVNGTKNIIHGDFSQLIHLDTQDELGILANSFNVMTKKLRRRIEMEKLAAEMSKRFISLPISKTMDEINKAVGTIGDLVDADRCVLYIINESEKSFKKAMAWKKRLDCNYDNDKEEISFEDFPWLSSQFQAPEIVYMSSIEDLPNEAELEKQYWSAMNLESVIIVPMFFGKLIKGFLILKFIKEIDHASVEDMRIIKIIAEIICSALERQKAETVLTNARNYFKNLFNAQSSILISINPEGKVIEWNSAAEQFTEITAKKAVSGDIWQLVPFLKNYKERIGAVLEKWEPQSILKEKVNYKGRKYLDISFFPLAHKKNSDVVIRIEDKTELEKKGHQLIQAQKMETVGTLAGGLAHDFNNILSVIIGSINLIQLQLKTNNADFTKLKKYIETITQSSYRASNLVKQLLSLSRKNEPSLEKVDLNVLIRNIVGIAENSFDKKVELSVNLFENRPIVLADSLQIEQSLLNVCLNAAHSMTIMRESKEAQGGTLSININKVYADTHLCQMNQDADSGTEYYQIQITDTGVGMSPEAQLKIFDPFYTTKSEGEGTGLGLAITYNIIKEHRGFINVNSELGQGTRFNLYLPAAGTDDFFQKDRNSWNELSKGSGTVLVIDDEDNVRITAENILKACGYHVLSAENGIKGIDAFKSFHPRINAVLLDMNMPRISGKETLIKIKEIDAEAKVIMTSGHMQEELYNELKELGIKGFLQKPYNIEELSTLIYNTIYK